MEIIEAETRKGKLIIDLIESWNDSNATEELNPYLIKLIERYIGYSYTISGEQMIKEILRNLELIADVNGNIKFKIAFGIIEKL